MTTSLLEVRHLLCLIQASNNRVSAFQVTETVSIDYCPVIDHETIPSNLNQSNVHVNSSIQEDTIVNQNLEAPLEGFA